MATVFRYAQLAEELGSRIRNGLYRPGERLPGVRRLARQFDVSVGTVQEALHWLEERGQVSARPRSGYYVNATVSSPQPSVCRPPARPEPVTSQGIVTEVLRAAGDRNMVQLGAAVPHASFLPRQALRRIQNSVWREHGDANLAYAFSPGHPALLKQLARRMTETGTPIHPERLVITNGCHEALTLALRAVTEPGDVVAVESPTYYGLLQALEAAGLKALEIPTDPVDGISLDALGFALEQWPVKACIVITNYSNPLGCVLSTEHKRALVALLGRHEVPLIEDDVYGDLPHGGPRPGTAKAHDHSGNVLYCNSFSKTIAPGLRVGWIAGGRFHERIETLKLVSNLANNTQAQLAVAALLESGAYERHLREVRSAYARAMGRMLCAVEAYFPSGTSLSRPDGSFLIWVQLPDDIDSRTLYTRARAEGISIAPGPMFTVSGKYPDCLRLNAAVPWNARVEQALVRLGQLAADASKGP